MSRGALSSRLVRRLAIASGVVAVVAMVLVALAPSIVSATVLSGIVRDQIAPHVRGTVNVVKASVSWSGPQLVHIRIIGEHDAVDATVSVHNGLIGLARASAPLDVRIGVNVDTASREDGSITLLELLQPPESSASASPSAASAPTPKDPFALPALLRGAKVSIDPLQVVVKPLGAGSTVRVDGSSATIALDGSDASVKAKGSTSIDAEREVPIPKGTRPVSP